MAESFQRDRFSWICELNNNDVLLGRGAVILGTEGHKRFRKLIQENKPEYTASSRHSVKHEIADRIMNIIAGRGGRFLRKIENAAEKERIGAPKDRDVYLIVDEEASMQKIKQALREQESSGKSPPKSRKRKIETIEDQAGESSAQHDVPTVNEASLIQGVGPHDSIHSSVVDSAAAQSHVSLAPSDQSLEFRLKHPSLRKRDLSRLRRQQEYSHLFADSTKQASLSVESLQGMMSVPLFPAPSPEPARTTQQGEGETSPDAEEDTKPKAVGKRDRNNE